MEKSEVLRKMAEYIVINAKLRKDHGLYHGKVGAALFLYNFDKQFPNDAIFNYSNELTLDVVNNLYDFPGNLYTSGISGIGRALTYLSKNEFISEDVRLKNVNYKVLSLLSYPQGLSLEDLGSAIFLRSSHDQTESLEMGHYWQTKADYLAEYSFYVIHQVSEKLITFSKKTSIYSLEEFCSFSSNFETIVPFLFFILGDDELLSKNIKILELALGVITGAFEDLTILIEKDRISNNTYYNKDVIRKAYVSSCSLYSILLKLMQYSSKELQTGFSTFQFLSCQNYFNERFLIFQHNRSVYTSDCIFILQSIKSILLNERNEYLNDLKQSMEQYIIDYLSDEDNFVSIFGLRSKTASIGLSGLSGIGLTLLDETEFTTWSHLIFKY